MVKPLLLVGMIGIHLHLLPERMELTPGNDRYNRLCDGMQQLDECVSTRTRACVCLSFLLKYECVWRGVLHPCIHVCNSACHTGQRVAEQDKGLWSGGECSPLTPSVTGPKHRNSPFGWFWLCVYVCVYCACASLRGLLFEVGCSLVPSDLPWTTIYW